MATTDPRVDAYIQRAAPFAQPVLLKIRTAFHKAAPGIVETMKWSAPHFELDGLVGGMAAFKAHVTFTLWKGKDLDDPEGLFANVGKTSMAAIKAKTPRELPTQKVLRDYIKRAVQFNRDARVDGKHATPKRKPAPSTPPDLLALLKQNAKARRTFETFPPSAKRDYVDWITSAKREATRASRLTTTLEWLGEGKRKNWKYESC